MPGQFDKTLTEFQNSLDQDKVRLGDMLRVLNNRGFGALLLIPCVIELLPTGSIPGVPSFCATLIILFSLQLAFGRRYPWVPERLANKKFKVDKINRGITKARPLVQWIDRQSRPRWRGLINHTNERVSTIFIILLALSIYPLELVPFASSIPSSLIAIIALSFITKDGFLLIASWIVASLGFVAITTIIYQGIWLNMAG